MFENFKHIRNNSGENINRLLEDQENKTPAQLVQA